MMRRISFIVPFVVAFTALPVAQTEKLDFAAGTFFPVAVVSFFVAAA